jgi:protein-tyrosine phosphatase
MMKDGPMKVVLFLCTGNYYRSRFAEELFNFLAPAVCPGWSATSRGLAVDLSTNNFGPIAKSAAQALAERGLGFNARLARMPLQLKTADLDSADHIVALKEAEHLPLLQQRFPAWLAANDTRRIEFWRIHDIDFMVPQQALPLIEEHLLNLIARLSSETPG